MIEHQGELLVGVVPRLVCNMLLGWDWILIYDTLGWVQDAEMVCQRLRDCDRWLGELNKDKGSVDNTDEVNLHNVASSP